MTTINVQFTDASKATICAYFVCPQDPAEYPNQEQIDSSDARWKAFFEALPASMQAGLTNPA